ncbi:MAG TPA: hypothetical protein VGK36_08890 [Candidatus Angelobacter sp.]|jgi:hypothetical protein
MENFNHLVAHVRDFSPLVLGAAVGYLCKLLRTFNKTVKSLGETRFKADECHEELCDRLPEFERRHKTYLAHRSNF